jgi:hypothetical protein
LDVNIQNKYSIFSLCLPGKQSKCFPSKHRLNMFANVCFLRKYPSSPAVTAIMHYPLSTEFTFVHSLLSHTHVHNHIHVFREAYDHRLTDVHGGDKHYDLWRNVPIGQPHREREPRESTDFTERYARTTLSVTPRSLIVPPSM